MSNEPYCEQQESPIFLQAVKTTVSEREKQNITGVTAEETCCSSCWWLPLLKDTEMEQLRRWGGHEQQQGPVESVVNKQRGPHTNIFKLGPWLLGKAVNGRSSGSETPSCPWMETLNKKAEDQN